MPVWRDCRVRVCCPGEPDFADGDCDVALDEGQLRVTYFDDEGPLVFVGRSDDADGAAYALTCRSRPRTATLRRAGTRLEGDWTERERHGTWAIELGEPDG